MKKNDKVIKDWLKRTQEDGVEITKEDLERLKPIIERIYIPGGSKRLA